MKTTAELKLQIAELKKQIEITKIKEAKIQKQQETRMTKILAQSYKDLKSEILESAKIDEQNCVKISFIVDLSGNKFKEVSYKKIERTKLIEKSKAIRLQSDDAPSVKKSSFKKGQMKLQG